MNPNNEVLKGIQVVNMLGQSVQNINSLHRGTYNEYDVQNLSSGTYIIKLSTLNNGLLTKKIIVK
jgi:hypothetical protein